MTVKVNFDDALYSQAVAVAEKNTSEDELLTIALQEFISKRKKTRHSRYSWQNRIRKRL